MGLFFTSNDDEKPKEEAVKEKITTFPSSPSESFESFPSTPPTASVIPTTDGNVYLNEILAVYQKGFEGLNQPGIDFYEFYKAVSADINNTASYKMALSVLQSVDSSFTKEKAISGSQHYVDNVSSAFKNFEDSGVSKRKKLTEDKALEASSLNSEILEFERQLRELQSKLESKKTQLNTIDVKYDSQLREVEGRLSANQKAKDILLSNITTVITNIKTNL
jgi:hypothetical protein